MLYGNHSVTYLLPAVIDICTNKIKTDPNNLIRYWFIIILFFIFGLTDSFLCHSRGKRRGGRVMGTRKVTYQGLPLCPRTRPWPTWSRFRGPQKGSARGLFASTGAAHPRIPHRPGAWALCVPTSHMLYTFLKLNILYPVTGGSLVNASLTHSHSHRVKEGRVVGDTYYGKRI